MRTEANKAAIAILRAWCKANGVVVDPLCAADLVSRIEGGIEIAMLGTAARERNRRRIHAIAHPEAQA